MICIFLFQYMCECVCVCVRVRVICIAFPFMYTNSHVYVICAPRTVDSFISNSQLVGLREKLQETPIFHRQIYGFL